MWAVFLVDRYFELGLYKYGVKPQTKEGLKGILFMPFLHSQKSFSHIFNNSIPTFILLACLIYFYRNVALKVALTIWFGSGILLWYIAVNTGSYHIGMSGVIYGLFSFLLLSGFLIKSLPVQAISLFVAFVYGSLIWGLFPTEDPVSWEGHLSGFLIGILLALVFRKKGPAPKKYRYEIEEEMGIPPPDYEGMWREKVRALEERERIRKEELEAQKEARIEAEKIEKSKSTSTEEEIDIQYHFVPKRKKEE